MKEQNFSNNDQTGKRYKHTLFWSAVVFAFLFHCIAVFRHTWIGITIIPLPLKIWFLSFWISYQVLDFFRITKKYGHQLTYIPVNKFNAMFYFSIAFREVLNLVILPSI